MVDEKTSTLEDLLRMKVPGEDKDENPIEITPDFRVAVQSAGEKAVHIIIHPNGHTGDTLDFYVSGNVLIPVDSTVGRQIKAGGLYMPRLGSNEPNLDIEAPAIEHATDKA